jgi:hypothetical protein
MRSLSLVSGLLFLLALGACKKPILETGAREIPPLMLATAIDDSLPLNAIQKLQLSQVSGLKFKYHTGNHSSYFEYAIDKNLLLKTLSELPFSIGVLAADTTCREISARELDLLQRSISLFEFENSSLFWADNGNVEVFECLKPPFRHIVKFRKDSKTVLHRIEFMG